MLRKIILALRRLIRRRVSLTEYTATETPFRRRFPCNDEIFTPVKPLCEYIVERKKNAENLQATTNVFFHRRRAMGFSTEFIEL